MTPVRRIHQKRVLYEMLTGRRAFEGASEASVISAILSSEPPAVAALAAAGRHPPWSRLIRDVPGEGPRRALGERPRRAAAARVDRSGHRSDGCTVAAGVAAAHRTAASRLAWSAAGHGGARGSWRPGASRAVRRPAHRSERSHVSSSRCPRRACRYASDGGARRLARRQPAPWPSSATTRTGRRLLYIACARRGGRPARPIGRHRGRVVALLVAGQPGGGLSLRQGRLKTDRRRGGSHPARWPTPGAPEGAPGTGTT